MRSPSVGGSEIGNCQILSFIQKLMMKSSRSFHGPIHLLLVANNTQPVGFGIARGQHYRVGIEDLRAEKFDELSHLSFGLIRKRAVFSSAVSGFFLIWRSVSKIFVSTSFCNLVESSVGSVQPS